MKMIWTHDGIIGLCFKPNHVIWCETFKEAISIIHGQFGHLLHISKHGIEQDVRYAIDQMRVNGHTIAEFGIMGTFMFTSKEEGHDF